MHKLLIALFALAALSLNYDYCEARILSRCELARELRWQGFPAHELRDWVCLVEAESARNTAFVTRPNSAGNRGWGLFQIWDTFWCSPTNLPGKECNVRCSDLLSPDITRASNCAKFIYRRHGLGAWNGWVQRCWGKPLPDISHCF